ncbi:MAG: RNA polymerase subunit sigma [Planctomycetes bacterium RBG_16_55_9]|nr:MAG: RNA polymerase subunit sigma [Planctomycetes bacterium RBG_16_55_9]
MTEVTRILSAIEQGDVKAADDLLPLIYEQLRVLAAQKLSQERPGQTLQATALVHEAYLKLVGTENHRWDSSGHFFAAAAQAMRRILVDNARRKHSQKYGGNHKRIDLDNANIFIENLSEDVIALDEALTKFEAEDPDKAHMIKLCYFGGLSIEQAASALKISRATAYRYWSYARAWLYDEMTKT